jgi:hypothetical protein
MLDQCTAPIRSFELSEVARSDGDGYVGVQDRNDAQISVRVIHDLRGATLVRRPTRPRMSKSPHTPTTGSCSTVARVIQAVTSWGFMPITAGRTLSNRTRDFLGTFYRELSDFSRVAVAPRIEDLRTTA